MRPLSHLGFGMDSADYDLYTLDESLYDQLSERGENLLESAKKEFMGDYYDNPPLMTLEELQQNLDEQISRSEKLVALKAPKEILQGENRVTMQLYKAIENKDYGSLSDPEYKKYRDAYFTRDSDWHKSDVKDNLLKEIYSYNETEYNKFKSTLEATNT